MPTYRGTDEGATAVEYAIMASFIAVVIVASVTFFGTQVVALFNAAAAI
jgi:Flp pilus assembly pilin Flp